MFGLKLITAKEYNRLRQLEEDYYKVDAARAKAIAEKITVIGSLRYSETNDCFVPGKCYRSFPDNLTYAVEGDTIIDNLGERWKITNDVTSKVYGFYKGRIVYLRREVEND